MLDVFKLDKINEGEINDEKQQKRHGKEGKERRNTGQM